MPFIGGNLIMKNEKILQLLEESVMKYKLNIAVTYKEENYTYQRLYEKVNELHNIIVNVSPRIQLPIGLYFKNSPEFIIGYYSLVKSKIIAMLVDHSLKANELLGIIKDCNLGGFLIHKDEIDIFPLKDIFKVVAEYDNFVLFYSEDFEYNRPYDKEKMADVISCRFSSGTTGAPKCMMYTQENVIAAAQNWRDTVGLNESDKILGVANYTHGLAFNTSMLSPLISGAHIFLIDSLMPRSQVKMIEKNKITIFVAFPVLYQMMSEEKFKTQYDLTSLRLCVSSGTVLHSKIKEDFKDNIGIYISDLFGVAETGLCILNTTADVNTVGKAISGVQIAIMDSNGKKLDYNEEGEIAIKSGSMSKGYYNFPGLLESRVTEDGFYLSGDIAVMHNDGYVYIKGRKQDFIDVAGKKVDPKEIEEVFLQCDKIEDIAAFGGKSTKTGLEVLCIAVVAKQELTRKDLVEYVQERLASYKIPQKIYFLNQLPRNSSGKVLRRELVNLLSNALE